MSNLIGSSGDDVLSAPIGQTINLSSNSNGAPGDNTNFTGGSSFISFSSDGTKIAFDVFGGNLTPGIGSSTDEVYVKNLITGSITHIDPPTYPTYGVSSAIISPDGNFVYFHANGDGQLYAENLTTNAVTLISANSMGIAGNANSTPTTVVGSELFFSSAANNLTSGTPPSGWNEYVENLNTGAITFVANLPGVSPVFSADHSTLAYIDLGPQQVHVEDVATGTATLASTSASGVLANAYASSVALSADGTELAFTSFATNLVAQGTNGVQQLYVKNLVTGAISLASTSASGTVGNWGSFDPVFSPDGTEIAFTSYASNLVAGDTNNEEDVFVKNLITGEMSLVSVSDAGQQSVGPMQDLTFSPNGSQIAFRDSGALTPGVTVGGMSVYLKTIQTDATLTGGAGADTFLFAPGSGADVITDFSHAQGDRINLAAFGLHDFGDVQALLSPSGANTVINLPGAGAVTLDGVTASSLTASDFVLASAASDFSGSGQSNMVWQNTSGAIAVWSVSGQALSGTVLADATPGWQLQDAGDFNGDGKSGDLLFRDGAGDVAIWEMSGTQIQSAAVVANVSMDWKIEGAADFNGDGKSDILWDNATTGQVAIWQMNGTAIQSAAVIATLPAEWHVAGTGDFNGDGKADILWRDNNTGDVAIWQMNGTQIQTGAVIATLPIASGWHVAGTGDFNGDGKADILWQNSASGQVAIWEMNGTQIQAAAVIAALPADWHVESTVDLNGDGKADIVWQNSDTHQVAVWEMNGTTIANPFVLAQLDNSWTALNHHYDWV